MTKKKTKIIWHKARSKRYKKKGWPQRHKVKKVGGYPGPKSLPLSKLVRGRPGKLIKSKVYHTKYVQETKTGLMKGRRNVPGVGDKTGIIFDPDTGRIFGKTKKYKK